MSRSAIPLRKTNLRSYRLRTRRAISSKSSSACREAIYITNPKAEELARQLSLQTGETITDTVIAALQERKERLNNPAPDERVAKLLEITQVSAALLEFVRHAGITIVPFAQEHLAAVRTRFAALAAALVHAAHLNFGDCMSYALRVTSNQPVLFKGNDFTYADVMRFSV